MYKGVGGGSFAYILSITRENEIIWSHCLTGTKLFHFQRMFKNGGEPSLDPPLQNYQACKELT